MEIGSLGKKINFGGLRIEIDIAVKLYREHSIKELLKRKEETPKGNSRMSRNS